MLVAVGGMRHEELLEVAGRAFGGWSEAGRRRRGARAGVGAETGSQTERRIALVHREAAAQSELRIGHLAAWRRTPDYPSLLVMNAVLGGQFTSRLNLKLREEKAYTYGARSGFDWKRGLSPFALSTSVHTASTAAAVADAAARNRGHSRQPSGDRQRARARQGRADARLSQRLRDRGAGGAGRVAARALRSAGHLLFGFRPHRQRR